MTDERLRELRHLHRDGKAVPGDLFDVLVEIVRKFVRLRLLPPSYAPYGAWNDDAVDEILQSWMTERLLGRGNLQRLLDEASSVASFRSMAERSLRQHLIGKKARSQASNTFHSAARLLESDGEFAAFRTAGQRHHTYWGLSDWNDPQLFAGDESMLLAHAWSLGKFAGVRYRPDAKKLAPLFAPGELKRFLVGLFAAVGECLTLTQIMRVIERQFDLGEIAIEDLEAAEQAAAEEVADDMGLREVATLLLPDLTRRQADIIVGLRDDKTLERLATELGCSAATVFNEESRIRTLVEREADSTDEAKQLLKILADLLYRKGGDE